MFFLEDALVFCVFAEYTISRGSGFLSGHAFFCILSGEGAEYPAILLHLPVGTIP